MKITNEEIKKIADKIEIDITDDEINKIKNSIEDITEFLDDCFAQEITNEEKIMGNEELINVFQKNADEAYEKEVDLTKLHNSLNNFNGEFIEINKGDNNE